MASASVIERNFIQTPAGCRIAQNEFGAISRMAGAPCVCIRRAVLQRILLDAVPSASVLTGARCSGFDDSTAILESGERIKADVLVGADGISSVIREGLHGTEEKRYAGYTCWRGIRQDHGALLDKSALLVIGAGSQFGLWPCGAGQLYWFLTKNAPLGTTQTKTEALRCAAIGPLRCLRSSKGLPRMRFCKMTSWTSHHCDGGAAAALLCWEMRRTLPPQTLVREPVRHWKMPWSWRTA